MNSNIVDPMIEELERMRARLLDLSAKNQLLNYTHPKGSSLRIVDEVPAIVLERILANDGYRFAPLEADEEIEPVRSTGRGRRWPSGSPLFASALKLDNAEGGNGDGDALSESNRERREAARAASAKRDARIKALAESLGIDPSYDLPAIGDSDEEQHSDRRLQTLLLPDELEKLLQKIQAKAVTAIQESGANTLHLLFGFVEWIDIAGGKERMAPLVLLPVTLARLDLDYSTHTFPYNVAASGEDWSTNITLQEKCKADFGFALPSVEADENLEDYFARVEEVLATAAPKGWRLCRRLTLGLVSFGKLLMWRDLDPTTWPEKHPLLGNPLICELLGTDSGNSDDSVAGGSSEDIAHAELRTEEYNIDSLPPERGPVPPIVVPADSSQHSVLVDVQRGHSLVVQGPPGTGKSQTITNIIADAIAGRKKVLFVAEKKAALDVVARRIEDAGLGEFCLPLHSHTTNKREFLDGLQERIALNIVTGTAARLPAVEELLGEERETLTGHVERLHAPFGSLGDTAFTVLWRARRLHSEMPEAVVRGLGGVRLANAVAVTPTELARQRSMLQAFGAAFAAMRCDVTSGDAKGDTHPWKGVTRADLRADSADALVALAREARVALEAAEAARSALAGVTDGVSWPESPEMLHPLLALMASLLEPEPDIPNGLIEAIHRRAGEASVEIAVAAADSARRAWAQIPGRWGTPGALSPQTLASYRATLDEARTLLGDSRTGADVGAAERCVERALEQLDAARTLAGRLVAELDLSSGKTAPLTSELTIVLVTRLIETARRAAELPEGALALRSPALHALGAAEKLAELEMHASALARASERYDEKFAPALRPSVVELREMAGALSTAPSFLPIVFSGRYRRATAMYRRMSGGRKEDRASMTADSVRLLRHVTELERFLQDPSLSQLMGASANGLRSPFGAALSVIGWVKQVTTAFRGIGEAGRLASDTVLSAPVSAWEEASAVLANSPSAVESALTLHATLSDLTQWTRTDVSMLEGEPIRALREKLDGWRTLAATAGSVMATARGAADSAHATDATVIKSEGKVEDDVQLVQLGERLTLVERAWAADEALACHESTFREMGLGLPSTKPEAEDADPLLGVRGALCYLSQFAEKNVPAALIDWLSCADPPTRLADLRRVGASLATNLATVQAVESRFTEAGGVRMAVWYGSQGDARSLTNRMRRFERATANSGSLARYVTWLRQRSEVERSPMPVAIGLLESSAVSAGQLPDAYDYLLARTLAEAVLQERPELDRFSGDVHETHRNEFGKLDRALITLTRRAIAENASRAPRVRGVGYGPVRDLTEQSLIEHEIGKTRRHIPIREMFRRAGRAIQVLKPCIMMGPQAVAQYLPPGLFHFDLVVMDEASQMRPEDALGAIARGSQLVVVGDPKQLGPTSFFDVHSSDDDEVDEAAAQLAATAAGAEELPRGASVLERSESILLAAARRYPMRMLRWHYRSRYPQLISFSNQEFYGGDLVLFPHPGSERPEDGVNFRSVDGALYSGNVNRLEAEAVVDAVCAHAANCPERTLLVVTMNQRQRELVDTLIQEVEKEDLALASFRERHEGTLEPFGVKNLENVQGDERDVIFVSTTYGPNDRGIVSQNFGPVNNVGGERRLNVLFTRAKYRLDVFCSFEPSALRVGEDSPRGLCVLRDYLRYANEGTLDGGRFTGKEPANDFEIEVARAIRARGLEVHAQIGVAGYFLDLAVVDVKHPGRYLLGIECDGATYHSAKSARDRDRLRQGHLETLGWHIHRIWSTDWFRDPHGEMKRLLRRIAELSRS